MDKKRQAGKRVTSLDAAGIVTALLRWYATAKREMPWRETRDPYAIWVSETMLQQTQVETVKPFYAKFLERFPTVADLAGAELEAVLQMWAGLGYYRRAKHLHAAARMIVERFGGALPRTAAQLIDLPGVGRYTAGAVASIAFGEAAPIVDGNVARVLTRVGAVKGAIKNTETLKRIWGMAEELVRATGGKKAGDFNQSLMELGALICLPVTPDCPHCPLLVHCRARQMGQERLIPPPASLKTNPIVPLLALRIRDIRGKILLMKRPRGGLWEEMWEAPCLAFPVSSFRFPEEEKGREEGRRSDREAARNKKEGGLNWERELADKIEEALGLRVVVEKRWARVRHELTHRRLAYWVAGGRSGSATPAVKLPACERGQYTAYRWVTRRGMQALPMATGMKKAIGSLDVPKTGRKI